MSVFYRKAMRRWVVRYDAGDCWRQKVCPPEITCERDAKRWEIEFLAKALDKGSAIIKRARIGEPPIAELITRWLALKAKDSELAEATKKQYRTHAAKWILPAFGTDYLSNLPRARLRQWVRDIREQVSPRTTRNVVVSATAFADDCLAEEWVDIRENPFRDPAVRRELPASRAVEAGIVTVPIEDMRTVLGDARHAMVDRVFWAVAVTTGMRAGEIVGLRWRDIGEETIRVERAYQLVGRTIGRTKTSGSVRTIPMHPLARAALTAWRTLGQAYSSRRPTPDSFVFANAKGKPMPHDHASDRLREALALSLCSTEAEGQPITVHALRRSFATWLADAGVAESDISALLGHAGKSVTARHYTAATLARVLDGVARIELDPSLIRDLTDTAFGVVHGVAPTPKSDESSNNP